MKEKHISICKVNISLGELFYYLFWCLMLFVKGIGWYDGMPAYKICFLIAVFCIAMKLCFTEHTIAEWIFIFVISVLGGIAYLNSHEKGILLGIMIIIGIKGVPLRRLFKVGLAVWGSCFLVMNILGVFDIVTGPILAHDKNGLGIVLRKSLGYTHPNVLHVTYAVLVAFILYLSTRKNIWKYIFLFLGNIYIFLYSFSYTGFLLVIIYLFLDFYLSYRKRISKTENILLQSVLPVCMIFAIVAPLAIPQDSRLFGIINKLLNVRFLASKVFMIENPLSLLGGENQTQNWALDSSYVSLLLHYGVIFLILFFVLYFATVRELVKCNDRKGMALVVSFLIAGVLEPFLVNTSFKNLSWLFAGAYLFDTFFQYGVFMNNSKLSRKIMLFCRWNKQLTISICDFEFYTVKIRSMKNKWKIVCFLMASLLGMGIGVLYYYQKDFPDAIYIGMQNTEFDFAVEENFLDIAHLPGDFQGAIYAYKDSESPLYKLSAEQLKYEEIRKSISIGSGIFGITLWVLVSALLLLQSNSIIAASYAKNKWRIRKVSYGNDNPDKTFYVVRRSTCNVGLFSYIMTNMGHVKHALEQGYIPVIDMKNNKNTYLHDEEVGKKNAWEFFFEQPCGYALEGIAKSKNVILSNGLVDGKISYPSIPMIHNEDELLEWRAVFQKYFIIKENIENDINKQYTDLFAGKKVLGVLCRGTDYVNTKPPQHPIQPSVADLMNKVKEVFAERQCEYIYLATEDEEVCQLFRNQFKEKLIVTQAKRYENTGDMNINDIIENVYDDKYVQGKDYLINIALLSKCNCLVAGCAGGTYGALLMSRGYEYQYIFDLGVY